MGLVLWGCLLPGGGVSAPRGSALGGSGPRGCLLPGSLVETPGTATAAGGTHPTGMHSCTKENNLSVYITYSIFSITFLSTCMLTKEGDRLFKAS